MDAPAELRRRQLRLLLLYALCSCPLIIFGAIQTLQSNTNSPLDWVPGTFPPRALYDQHTQRFGFGDVVFLTWADCTVDDPRLDDFTQALRQDPQFLQPNGTRYFQRVTSGREVLQQLISNPQPVSREIAVNRLQGILIGPDLVQTMVIVTFTPAALKKRSDLVEEIEAAVTERFGVPKEDQHLAGPVIDGLSVDRAGRASLDRLAVPSSVIVLVLSVLCLGSIRGGLIVFGLSVYCQFATLSLIHYTGESMSALLIVLPPLIQVLSVAGGVHLTNYYYDAREELSLQEAPQQAIRLGWLPCLLSAGTTALGIGSLAVSQLSPIRLFGYYGSVGVVLTTAFALILVPAIWSIWPPKRYRWKRPTETDQAVAPDIRSRIAARATGLLSHSWAMILAIFLVAIVGSSLNLDRLRTSVRIETLFQSDSRILRDYRWIEDHVGALVPIDLVVSWPEATQLTLKERMLRLWKIQTAARSLPEVGASISAIQLFPAMPSPTDMPQQQYEQTVEYLLSASRPSFIDAGLLVQQNGREYWRLTVQLSAMDQTDYGAFLKQLEREVTPVIDEFPQTDDVSIEYTGIMPLVHEIQRQLMRDLFESFLGALALITVIMTISQGGIVTGLVTMIPNVFPVLLMFGLLGRFGTPLDIGTVTTASVALGIAVDDTLHFLSFFQRGLGLGKDRRGAIEFAFRHCGAAMIQTSLICGLGLLVFAQAEFLPTQRFAWITASLIATALAADLCLLPALLLSPLGLLFDFQHSAETRQAQTTPADDEPPPVSPHPTEE